MPLNPRAETRSSFKEPSLGASVVSKSSCFRDLSKLINPSFSNLVNRTIWTRYPGSCSNIDFASAVPEKVVQVLVALNQKRHLKVFCSYGSNIRDRINRARRGL